MAYSEHGISRAELNKPLNDELDGMVTSINNISSSVTTINNYINDNKMESYKSKVLTTDDDGNITSKEYRRSDNTLAIKAVASNPDTNGYYRTLNLKYYKEDGTTLLKTIEFHFTFLENGLINTSDGGVLV